MTLPASGPAATGPDTETSTSTSTDLDPDSDSDAGPEALIAERRRRIDALDTCLIALVQERMSLSAEVQAARLESGGRRLHLAREMEILRTYGDALGRPGTTLAMTLLELCRGRA
jgi:chorismate mutase